MMRLPVLFLLLIATAVPAPGGAETEHKHGHHGAPTAYGGLADRAVKALSAEEIAALETGQGFGMALPAELNGYPGPAHVLDLAEPLRLSVPQRQRTQALFDAMTREAREHGLAVIAAETDLERLFAERRAAPAAIAAATARAAEARGRLRATHLRTHLDMMDVLTADQIAAYQRLRGYAAR